MVFYYKSILLPEQKMSTDLGLRLWMKLEMKLYLFLAVINIATYLYHLISET
jgi:hypothetical protein